MFKIILTFDVTSEGSPTGFGDIRDFLFTMYIAFTSAGEVFGSLVQRYKLAETWPVNRRTLLRFRQVTLVAIKFTDQPSAQDNQPNEILGGKSMLYS